MRAAAVCPGHFAHISGLGGNIRRYDDLAVWLQKRTLGRSAQSLAGEGRSRLTRNQGIDFFRHISELLKVGIDLSENC